MHKSRRSAHFTHEIDTGDKTAWILKVSSVSYRASIACQHPQLSHIDQRHSRKHKKSHRTTHINRLKQKYLNCITQNNENLNITQHRKTHVSTPLSFSLLTVIYTEPTLFGAQRGGGQCAIAGAYPLTRH